MLIEDLVIWILVCYGITNGVVGSSILGTFRRKVMKFNETLGDLVSCPMCFGFWAGILVSLVWASPTGEGAVFLGPEWYHHILDGFLASGTCWLFHTWEESKL